MVYNELRDKNNHTIKPKVKANWKQNRDLDNDSSKHWVNLASSKQFTSINSISMERPISQIESELVEHRKSPCLLGVSGLVHELDLLSSYIYKFNLIQTTQKQNSFDQHVILVHFTGVDTYPRKSFTSSQMAIKLFIFFHLCLEPSSFFVTVPFIKHNTLSKN